MASISTQRGILAFALAALCGGFTGSARAYCLAQSCDPDAVHGDQCELDPTTTCSVDGVALRRAKGCINVAIQLGTPNSVPGLEDSELEQIVVEALSHWAAVDCGDGPPAIQVQSVGVVHTPGKFACTLLPAHNLNLWMMADDLPSPQVVQQTTGAIAGVTYPSYVLETGEIFDADVKLNTLWFLVQDPMDLRGHLRTVAMHEAGHVLGLAHSQDADAVMFKSYVVTTDRDLTSDDKQAVCALYPPGPLNCDPPTLDPAALNQNGCNEAYLASQHAQQPDAGHEPHNPPASSGCACAQSSAQSGRAELLVFALGLSALRWRRVRCRLR